MSKATLKAPRYAGRKKGPYPSDDLEASIKRHGFLQPIVIGPDDEVIIGHRRAEAAKALGINPPIIRRPDLTDPAARLEHRISEELSHQPMVSLERAAAIKALWELKRKDNPSITRAALAETIGVSVSVLQQYLTLADVSSDITAHVGATLSPRSALEIDKAAHLSLREKIALAKKIASEKVPGSEHALQDKVLPFLKHASKQTKQSLLENPRTTYEAAVEHETRKVRREASRAAGDDLDPVGMVGQRITAKFETFEMITREIRQQNLFPLLPPIYQRAIRRLIDTIQRDFDAMLKGKADPEHRPSEKRLASLLEKTEEWDA
jgi:ParB/RepB/Spo0J family partition protein